MPCYFQNAFEKEKKRTKCKILKTIKLKLNVFEIFEMYEKLSHVPAIAELSLAAVELPLTNDADHVTH